MIAKRIKLLSLTLIFSGALNVGLIAALTYSTLEKVSVASNRPGKKEMVTTNGQIFRSMAKLTFRELVSFLTNRELLEEGYTKRDLAIAALVAYHHFNLEKALSAPPAQTRTLLLSKDQTIDVFPGLTEEQFEAIIRFAYQEKWPLTAKGLFVRLQMMRDPSLEQAFCLTPEFHALQILFQKTHTPQEPQSLLNLAISGRWELLDQLHKERLATLEFSEDKRRAILLSYLAQGSSEAALLLIKTDFMFALKRLGDQQILELLSLCKQPTDEGSRFCMELLKSARSDSIWQAAALALYSYAEEMPPLPIDPQTALARFASCPFSGPKITSQEEPVIQFFEPSYFHVVKEGESLWKISRQYKVKVEEIVQINGLENHSLFPGMTLKLPPHGTGSEPPR